MQAFRRLPRAGASPCSPRSINPSLHDFQAAYKQHNCPNTHQRQPENTISSFQAASTHPSPPSNHLHPKR
ncbi:hypothetical protein, partial [uncultured Kingella sp.]|uniref:hypothetical protein n=1 Tax=uncultured Kingella sp. TaxID=159270 RepID=UPI00259554DC